MLHVFAGNVQCESGEWNNIGAQSMVCHKDDWVEQVIKDKVDIDLQLSDNEIASMSKEKFRVLVKNKTKVIAIKSK